MGPWLAEALDLDPKLWFTEGLSEIAMFVFAHFPTLAGASAASALTPATSQERGNVATVQINRSAGYLWKIGKTYE